jgi:hypothetical protein
MRFLAERFHILAWWSAFSKRGSQDLSNGTNVNVWLANFFLSVHVLYWTWRSFIVRFFPHFCLLVDYSKYFFSCSVAEGMEFVDLLSSCNLLNHNFLYFPWLPVETGTSFIRKQTFFGSSTWRTSCCTSVRTERAARTAQTTRRGLRCWGHTDSIWKNPTRPLTSSATTWSGDETVRWVLTTLECSSLWGRSSARGLLWRHFFFDQLNWCSSWVLVSWLLISNSKCWWNVPVCDCVELACFALNLRKEH